MWPVARSRSGRWAYRSSRSPASLEAGASGPDDLGAENLDAEARVAVGLSAAEPVVHVQRRDPVPELAQREEEAGGVGPAGDEAQHLAARLDQVVPAHVRLDPLEDPHTAKCAQNVGAASHRSRTPTTSSSSASENSYGVAYSTSGIRAAGSTPALAAIT